MWSANYKGSSKPANHYTTGCNGRSCSALRTSESIISNLVRKEHSQSLMLHPINIYLAQCKHTTICKPGRLKCWKSSKALGANQSFRAPGHRHSQPVNAHIVEATADEIATIFGSNPRIGTTFTIKDETNWHVKLLLPYCTRRKPPLNLKRTIEMIQERDYINLLELSLAKGKARVPLHNEKAIITFVV